tara:strand:+ start:111 stop:299 length:189 start_codon:yes stop_codon:yes gene_type:complete
MNTIYTSGLGYISTSVISQSLGTFKENSTSKIQGSGLKEQLDKKLESLDLNSKNKNIKFSVD